MKRLIILVGLLCLAVGFLAGYATNPRMVAAQAPAPGGGQAGGLALGPAALRIQDGKGFAISMDDVKQKYPPADPTGKYAQTGLSTLLGWDPVYSLVVERRAYNDPPVKNNVSGNMVHWGGAEMHEEKAQIYMIISGTGQVALGGQPPNVNKNVVNGQHGGEPLGTAEGATLYRVKAGDMVVIPPYTWHQAQADPGQTIRYMKVDIMTPRLMP